MTNDERFGWALADEPALHDEERRIPKASANDHVLYDAYLSCDRSSIHHRVLFASCELFPHAETPPPSFWAAGKATQSPNHIENHRRRKAEPC